MPGSRVAAGVGSMFWARRCAAVGIGLPSLSVLIGLGGDTVGTAGGRFGHSLGLNAGNSYGGLAD